MCYKNLLSFFLILTALISCSTIKFGSEETFFLNNDDSNIIKEFDLTYHRKIMGVPVKGEKSVVENIFLHPDNKTFFICISFPKIGILTTNDLGKNISSQFFKLGHLEKTYGYSSDDSNNNENIWNNEGNSDTPSRLFYHFSVSPSDPNKIAISMGPYLILSADKGKTWESKNIFFDMQNTNIRDVFITKNNEIIVISENKISTSSNWGKKWKRKLLKINDSPFFKTEYLTGLYDKKNDILYASIKFNNESHNILSKSTYDYFYKNIPNKNESGVYYSPDKGLSWKKSSINVPVVLWKNNESIYGASIYPLDFYKYDFSEAFLNSELYKSAVLNKTTKNVQDYVNILISSANNDISIISNVNNKLIKFQKIDDNISFVEESDFSNLYKGIKKVQYLDCVQWDRSWYDNKKSSNFAYEYNFWKMFKLWTGMRTNSPIIYTKDKNGIFYRIKPHPKFVKVLIKYSVEKQIMINSKNPFLKKRTDVEFFDPKFDPTYGFPVLIEYSKNNGKTWLKFDESEHLNKIIDPLGKKRSGFYWYKNVEQKKVFKLQVSFGFDQGITFLVYPMKLLTINNQLLINLNYFSVTKSYKDLYQIPIEFIHKKL